MLKEHSSLCPIFNNYFVKKKILIHKKENIIYSNQEEDATNKQVEPSWNHHTQTSATIAQLACMLTWSQFNGAYM
ncbi:hypothetical protein VNO77_05983 [Canavalia gladiata]|uniref:Uncharacterized protein n=1 Tax=Canavalia gladiata TaxID=3824 RepID=A0AAN9MZA8_CANGL